MNTNNIIPAHYQDKLASAGDAAKAARNIENWPAYESAIIEIDSISRNIRKDHPDSFWQQDDPAYQKLVAKWADERRKNKVKQQ